MASDVDRLLIRILHQGEHLGLLASVVALMIVEAGYLAWLGRLPVLPNPAHQPGFLDLPPWYQRPRVEVTFPADNSGRIDLFGGLGRGPIDAQQNRRVLYE